MCNGSSGGGVDIGANCGATPANHPVLSASNTADPFYVLVKTGAGPVSGTFKDTVGRTLTEGAVFKVADVESKITYQADLSTSTRSGGNDVAVWRVPAGTLLIVR